MFTKTRPSCKEKIPVLYTEKKILAICFVQIKVCLVQTTNACKGENILKMKYMLTISCADGVNAAQFLWQIFPAGLSAIHMLFFTSFHHF